MPQSSLKSALAFAAAMFASGADAMDNPAHLTVLEGWREADGTHVAAVRLDLDEGWKTYWRAPGDAGIPPVFDFLGSRNLVDFSVIWPTPVVFDQAGMQSVGYTEVVVLPIRFDTRHKNRDVQLRGQVELGVCKEICLPVTIDIDAVLSADATKKPASIRLAQASVPYTAEEAGVKSAICKLEATASGLEITTRVVLPSAGEKEVVILESANNDLWLSETNSSRDGDVLTSVSSLVSLSGAPVAVKRSDIRITVLGSDHAVDIKGCTGS